MKLSTTRQIVHPRKVGREPGAWSHISMVDLRAAQKLVFLAGQTALKSDGTFDDIGGLDEQFDAIYGNIEAALAEVGAGFQNIVSFRTFLTKEADPQHFRRMRNERHASLYPGGDAPPNTLVICEALAEPQILIEIEVVAVI